MIVSNREGFVESKLLIISNKMGFYEGFTMTGYLTFTPFLKVSCENNCPFLL